MTVAVSTAAAIAQIQSVIPAAYDVRIEIAFVSISLITIANLRGLRESGQHLRRPDVPVRGPGPGDRRRSASSGSSTGDGRPASRPSRTRCRSAREVDRHPAAAQGVRRRLGRPDRRRGDRQRRAGVQAARSEERREHDDRDGDPARHPVRRADRRSPSSTACARPRRAAPSVVALAAQTAFGEGSRAVRRLRGVSTALILFLAANTSFNAFPRLAAILAEDGYMPRQFSFRGDRLAYSWGIVLLAGGRLRAALGVRRRHPRADPALLGRRVRVLHAEPARDGPPLAPRTRVGLALAAGRQRVGRAS